MTVCDFRSDTVTLPTADMMVAIASAPLGDSARGDDPTVNELERFCAELTGKDDAVFVPSGTMANLSAIMGHGCYGGQVIVEASSHIYNSEGGGLSVLAGAVARPVRGAHGVMAVSDIAAAVVAPNHSALASTRLICLENTHNEAGGCVIPMDHLVAVYDLGRQAKVPVHLDGARLFNAATYLSVPIIEICRHVDSVWFALCKGLGAPIGAVLAGDTEFMLKARRAVKQLGGAMRQAGIIAAPGIVALRDPYGVHRRDHAMAQRLARGLAAIDESLVDAPHVQTNIVNCYVDRFSRDATAIHRALQVRGILTNFKGSKIRFVTHYHIDEQAVDVAITGVAEVIEPFRRAA
jgi:threonine aldolase